MKKRMNKIICLLVCFCCLIPTARGVLAAPPEPLEDITISINSKEIDSVPIVYNENIYIKISDLVPWINMDAFYSVNEKKLYINSYANSSSFHETPVMTIQNRTISMEEFNIFAKWLRFNSGISDFSTAGFAEFKQFVVDQIKEAAGVHYLAQVNGIEMKSQNYTELNDQLRQIEEGFGSKEDFYSFLKNEIGIAYLDYYCIQEYYYFRDMVVEKLTEESTEEACLTYYNSRMDQFRVNNAQVKHILFKTTDENGTILPYVQKKEVEKKALAVLKGIETNKYIFDKAMYLFSEDAATSSNSGGFLATQDSVQPEFWAGIADTREGLVDSLIETKYGYHIVKVINKSQVLPYHAVRNQIEVIVKNNAFQSLLQESMKKMNIMVENDLLQQYNIY